MSVKELLLNEIKGMDEILDIRQKIDSGNLLKSKK